MNLKYSKKVLTEFLQKSRIKINILNIVWQGKTYMAAYWRETEKYVLNLLKYKR